MKTHHNLIADDTSTPSANLSARLSTDTPRNTNTSVNHQSIAENIKSDGYVVIDDALNIDLLNSLFTYLKSINKKSFKQAGIGRDTNFQLNPFVRTDEIIWLDKNTNTDGYFHWMEDLRLQLNQALFLCLFDYETHFSHYPPGAFYKWHYDGFKQSSNRIISTILYLNPDWQEHDGGELCIYNAENNLLKKVAPIFGRMVIFLSEEFPHEVLPTKTDRYSLTGWFRVNNNGRVIDPPISF
ncbi:MAG: 2OG-Fe(II) oxygenase [Gammaproteobacteria bacterium]|nr:2OG-Fe(II) oxygenase [Gammaproteobacteria bacterium]